MRQILLSVQFLLVCIKVEVVIRQAVREAQLGPEEVSVSILSLQIRVTRYASRDCIVVTGGKLLVVGEVGHDAGHVLAIKSCAYVDAPELLGLQQENQIEGVLVGQPVLHPGEDIQPLQHGQCTVYLLLAY